MRSNQFFIFLFSICFFGRVGSEEKSMDSTLVIEGDRKNLDISDIALPNDNKEGLNLFYNRPQPEQELLKLLEHPESFLDFDEKMIALDFDEKMIALDFDEKIMKGN